jgi:hypothetical protein
MKPPNGDKAAIDLQKLRDYCLSTVHPRGKHKARLFEDVASITAKNIDKLLSALRDAAVQQDATPTRDNSFDQLYELTFEFVSPENARKY